MIHFIKDENGTTAIEYALVASLIFLAIIGILISLGDTLILLYYDKILEAFQST